MRIATWNVNSARARLERICAVLSRHDLDVLALQEIKCKTEQFPEAEIRAAGYEVIAHGLNQWNGVAIISRLGMENVRYSFPGQPGFLKGEPPAGQDYISHTDPEARALGVTTGGIDFWSLYVPNGRAVEDPHYYYKLDFLHQLAIFAEESARDSQAQIALAGDWNVIPTDADVWDATALESDIYMTEAERAAFFNFSEIGYSEITRPFTKNYTFWDYQRLRFPRNEGMRIDYIYASPALAARAKAAHIDRDERKGKGASDHVPVIVDLAD